MSMSFFLVLLHLLCFGVIHKASCFYSSVRVSNCSFTEGHQRVLMIMVLSPNSYQVLVTDSCAQSLSYYSQKSLIHTSASHSRRNWFPSQAEGWQWGLDFALPFLVKEKVNSLFTSMVFLRKLITSCGLEDSSVWCEFGHRQLLLYYNLQALPVFWKISQTFPWPSWLSLKVQIF